MQPSLSDSKSGAVAEKYLIITNASGRAIRFELTAGSSYLAGSSDNCRIALSGNDVNPIHCRFWLDENCQLRIQDWNTGGKTRLNGQPTEEAVLSQGDELEIGEYRITIGDSPSTSVEPVPTIESFPAPELPEIEFVADQEPRTSESFSAAENESTFSYELDWDTTDAAEEVQQLESPEMQHFEVADEANGEVDQEVEWLKMEVEQLRIELAERDAQIERGSDSFPESYSEFNDDPQTVKLVHRLEELLEELKCSDGRIRGLEDLLQASDEAAQAEQEERLQLENWVTEIEQRITQREAENAAEFSRVMQQLKDAQAKHRQAEAQLEQAFESNAHAFSDSSNQIINKLRSQMDSLRERLKTAEAENKELRSTDRNQASESAAEKIQQLEQKLLQQQVEFSRERAEIARKRVQLERLRDELEQSHNTNHKMDDANTRVMAMRQHLRDIHEEEKLEREERKQRSLGGRIARLLNRVGS